MISRKFAFMVFLVLTMLLATVGSVLSQQDGPNGPLERIAVQTDGTAQVATHRATGLVRFIGADIQHPIPVAADLPSDASPEVVARAFLGEYGDLFGLQNTAAELTLMRTRASDSRTFVRFQQTFQGIPVLGGELIVQTTTARQVLSVIGETLPDINLSVTPQITAEAASQNALRAVAKQYSLQVDDLQASLPELWVYNPALLGGPGLQISSLVWRVEVKPVELLPLRELVLVDAQLGAIALSFNQVDTAINRQTYDARNTGTLPGLLIRYEGQANSGNTEVDFAHNFAGDTYNYYYAIHGRDGIDNAGLLIKSTVNYCPQNNCPFINAFWNGEQMAYGPGMAGADDVVAHELTHGVTQYESGLFYYMQSGAINEALSDLWGEFVDQHNGDTDTPWLMGEDIPAFPSEGFSGGPFRSMSNPPAYGDPDKMTSPIYNCDINEQDQGGVHANSGIANKAVYLMADPASKTFNGQTITGIGLAKTAKIWYQAQIGMLTSGSDYADLYMALQQSCNNLTASGVTTAADCQQVKKALDAVEMHLQPVSCAAPEAPVCPAGQTPAYIFNDNLENTASGKWTSSKIAGVNAWYYPPTINPYDFDATYATSGLMNFWGYAVGQIGDYALAMTSNAPLPAGKTAYLRFKHTYNFEGTPSTAFDGGVLEYSTNNGSTWKDTSLLSANNGYNGTITSSFDNPLGGRKAFVSVSNGYISTRLNLAGLAGQNVRFRFRIGTDSEVDDYGWFIDDIQVYTCQSPVTLQNFIRLPIIARGSVSVPAPTPIPPTPTSQPPAWTNLVSETFEGAFPGSLWDVFDDNGSTYGEYYWTRSSCQANAGSSYSGWAIGGGANGSSLSCGALYANYTNSWMIAGPFNLSDAAAADLSLKIWLNSEDCSSCDRISYMASTNGTNFWGYRMSGNSGGWTTPQVLNLANVDGQGTSYLGQPQVWIAVIFQSDETLTYADGAYVDNIVFRKCSSGCTSASTIQPAPSSLLVEPVQEVLNR